MSVCLSLSRFLSVDRFLFSDILKVYNPDITGYSVGWGPVWLESVSRLNVANAGDESE